jgi:response regulator of citrate/malate metabolism
MLARQGIIGAQDLADIERGMAAGFADYMTKPLDLARFIATINRYLSDSKETRA